MNAEFRALCVAAALALCACGSSSNAPPDTSQYACPAVDAGAACAAADAATYQTIIQPILAKSCLPACHDGSPDAAWPLTDPDDIQAWKFYVDEDLTRCSMPPPGSALLIGAEGRAAILNWLACTVP